MVIACPSVLPARPGWVFAHWVPAAHTCKHEAQGLAAGLCNTQADLGLCLPCAACRAAADCALDVLDLDLSRAHRAGAAGWCKPSCSMPLRTANPPAALDAQLMSPPDGRGHPIGEKWPNLVNAAQ
jgi:hypothetical protein